MAEDEVVAEARQSIMQLVRLLRTINGAMNNRRQTRAGVQQTDQFVNRFDEQLPGMRYEMNSGEHLDDAQLADRFDSEFNPEWADRAAQTVDGIPPTHPVYSDPQVNQARQAYVDQYQRYAAAQQAYSQQLSYLQQQGYAQAPAPTTLSAAAQRAQQAGRLGQGLMEAQARVEADAVTGQHTPGGGTMSVDELHTLLDAEDGRHRTTRPDAISVSDLQARLAAEAAQTQGPGDAGAAAGDPALADGLRAQAMSDPGEVRQADGTSEQVADTAAGSNGEQDLRHRRAAAAPQVGTRDR